MYKHKYQIVIIAVITLSVITSTQLAFSATQPQSLEAEIATLDGAVEAKSDTVASGSAYIEYGAPSTSDPFLQGDSLYEAYYDTSSSSGWSTETSGSTERFSYSSQGVTCYAGGYPASTHYARIRRKLPERDNVVARGKFSIESRFTLPSTYYSDQESYMRLITTDNYPTQLQSGESVGATSGDEWRVGFTIYGSDKRFRLISSHENNEEIVLWKADNELPVGTHTVKINFEPATDSSGSWELFIDDEKIASQENVRTIPNTMSSNEIAITRVGACIDGAAQQDTKEVNTTLQYIRFRAEQ